MKISSEDKKSFIEIIVRDAYCEPMQPGEADDDWHMTVSLQMTTEWFIARLPDVTLYRSFVEQFLLSLRELNEKRKGIAKLEGLGYEKFALSIFNTNERGYLAVSLEMEKYELSSERYLMKATGGFDLDPGDLPQILYDFEKLFSKQRLTEEFGK